MTWSEFALWGPDPGGAAVGVLEAELHPEGRRRARERTGPYSTVSVRLVAEGYTAGEDVSVAVYVGPDRVGRLSASDSVAWLPVVEQVESAGLAPTVSGVFTGDDDDVGLRVMLADPAVAVPRNAPPREAHTLLPEGSSVPVRVDEARAGFLQPLVRASGVAGVVLTLHRVHVPGSGQVESGVEVRLDSRAVGMLDDVDAERILPVVDHFSRRGLTAAVCGTIRGRLPALPEDPEAPAGPMGPTERAVSVTIAAGSAVELGPRVLNGPPQPVPSLAPRPFPTPATADSARPPAAPENSEPDAGTRHHDGNGDEASSSSLPGFRARARTWVRRRRDRADTTGQKE